MNPRRVWIEYGLLIVLASVFALVLPRLPDDWLAMLAALGIPATAAYTYMLLRGERLWLGD